PRVGQGGVVRGDARLGPAELRPAIARGPDGYGQNNRHRGDNGKTLVHPDLGSVTGRVESRGYINVSGARARNGCERRPHLSPTCTHLGCQVAGTPPSAPAIARVTGPPSSRPARCCPVPRNHR